MQKLKSQWGKQMTKEVHQCPSCGGVCKKSGCERRDTIVPCRHFRVGITNKTAAECPYCEIDKWKTNYSNAMDVNADLRAKLAARSAEYLAAHITYDKGYQAGRDDTKDAEEEFNRGIKVCMSRLHEMTKKEKNK